MTVRKCQCKYTFVMTEAMVFGPIFEDNNASYAHLMTRSEFEDEYGDCSNDKTIRGERDCAD